MEQLTLRRQRRVRAGYETGAGSSERLTRESSLSGCATLIGESLDRVLAEHRSVNRRRHQHSARVVAALKAKMRDRATSPRSRDLLSRVRLAGRRRAFGSSAATDGLTTLATVAWITCSRAVKTSTCWCSIPRSIQTPEARRRRQHRWARWRSLRPAESRRAKKDLGMMAIRYGNVYVAQVAMGANDTHTIKAFLEAEAHRRTFADHRLQPVHRSRHRHGEGDAPTKAGGGFGLLAALSLRSATRRRRTRTRSNWIRAIRGSRSRTTSTPKVAIACCSKAIRRWRSFSSARRKRK